MYASGYLHRDISIGNIHPIDPPAPVASVVDHLKQLTDRQIDCLTYANQVSTPSPQPTDDAAGEDACGSSDQTTEQRCVDELWLQQKRLFSLLSELELDKCSAFVTDSGMAIELETLFSQTTHQNELSVSSVLHQSGPLAE